MDKTKRYSFKRRWLCFSRNVVNYSRRCYDRWLSIFKACKNCISPFTQYFIRKNEKHKKFGLLNDIKGGVTSVEVLVYVPLIAFLLFNGVDYYVTSTQYNNLESRKNYYLDVMRIEGAYTYELDQQVREELTAMGFRDISIDVSKLSGGTKVGIGSNEFVYRNIDQPQDSRIFLEINVKPSFTPFAFGKLLGAKVEEEFIFKVKGEALSEKSYYQENDIP